jgi:hypothetical protein
MRTFALLLLVAVALVMRPARALACKCDEGPNDLAENLKRAREHASVIYLAQVVSIERGLEGTLARVKVLETFKGDVSVGHTPMVPTGGHHDCTFGFNVGKTYVIYNGASWCSRTREIVSVENDVELKWLRTGVLPPTPKALLRETVKCEPCDLRKLAPALVGQPIVRGKELAAAVAEPAPFWTAGFDSDGLARQIAVGRALDGGLFELAQTPYFTTREACRQRVVKRSCERLEPDKDGEPPLRCVVPGPEVELCNEERSRVASWGQPEELSAASCNWRDPAIGRCELSESAKPLREQPAAQRSGVLRCSPQFDSSWINACVIEGKR